MIEIKARVIGAMWLYASHNANDTSSETVVVSELRPAVDSPVEIDLDLESKVDLVITIACDEVLYRMKIRDIALGVARDMTDDLITSQSIVAYFESEGSISSLLSRSTPYAVVESELIGVPSSINDDLD